MIIVQVFCLFISAMVTLINIYKLYNIKKVLLTLEELDNLEDDDRNIIINNTTYILNDDIDFTATFYYILLSLSIIFNIFTMGIGDSTTQFFSGLLTTFIVILTPIFMIEFVNMYLRGKIVISNDDYLFRSAKRYSGFYIINERYSEFYIINARKELRVYITTITSSVLIGFLCWISTLLYLIITLLTTN